VVIVYAWTVVLGVGGFLMSHSHGVAVFMVLGGLMIISFFILWKLGMFDKVLDIRRCWLKPEPSNALRDEVKRFSIEHGYTFHNALTHEGLMRNMVVRTASTGEVMVIVVFGADDRPKIEALLDHLAAKFPEITSLCYVVNTKFNDSTGDLDAVCYRGKDHIVEEM